MTTLVLLAAAVVGTAALGLALMLGAAAARADRRMARALLDTLGWSRPEEGRVLEGGGRPDLSPEERLSA